MNQKNPKSILKSFVSIKKTINSTSLILEDNNNVIISQDD